MRLYDYGKAVNIEKYGQSTPPLVDLSKITEVPVAMFVGTADDLGDTTDARWAQDEINKNGTALVHYQEIPAGHSSFLIGKNMAYFDTVMDLVTEFNPLP